MQNQQPENVSPQPPTTYKLGMFERRIGRLGFLLGFIYPMLFFAVPALFQILVSSSSTDPATGLLFVVNMASLILGIVGLILYVPSIISLFIRRLHDLNQSGWFTLLYFVPLANIVFVLYLLFAPGTTGQNKYGLPIKSYNFWVILGFKQPSTP